MQAKRRLLYYTGDESAQHIETLITFAKNHPKSLNLPVHGDLAEAVFAGMKSFILTLPPCARQAQFIWLAFAKSCKPMHMSLPPNNSFKPTPLHGHNVSSAVCFVKC